MQVKLGLLSSPKAKPPNSTLWLDRFGRVKSKTTETDSDSFKFLKNNDIGLFQHD